MLHNSSFNSINSIRFIQFDSFSPNRLNNGQLAPALQKIALSGVYHRLIILIHPKRHLMLSTQAFFKPTNLVGDPNTSKPTTQRLSLDIFVRKAPRFR